MGISPIFAFLSCGLTAVALKGSFSFSASLLRSSFKDQPILCSSRVCFNFKLERGDQGCPLKLAVLRSVSSPCASAVSSHSWAAGHTAGRWDSSPCWDCFPHQREVLPMQPSMLGYRVTAYFSSGLTHHLHTACCNLFISEQV